MESDLTRRLPVEILAMIFHVWKDTCRSTRNGLGADWVRATWICKRWREVALETSALWSSVLISQPLTDDPAVGMQLDRARGAALDLFVSNPQMSSGEVEDALGLVLAKTLRVKKLEIVYSECHAVVEEFIKNVAAEVVSLSIDTYTFKFGSADENRWPFTSDPLLLNLTRLDLTHALDEETELPGTGVHRFLAACPNLEALRTDNCFGYEVEDFIERRGKHILPVVALPKLRSLSMDELALDISTALGTLRLPALSTFHITGNCANETNDCHFFVIPQNISETLPPIRRSRCLSLIVGGCLNDLSFRGGPGDTFSDSEDSDDDDDDGWASPLHQIQLHTLPGQDPGPRRTVHLGPPPTPHLNGLPVARDWARFFAAMPRLRTLGIGAGALIRHVLEAFSTGGEADSPGLCPELEDLELCVGGGLDTEEGGGGLAEFILRTVGAWVRRRATPLRSLTVQTRTGLDNNLDFDGSDEESASGSDSTSRSDEELSDGAGSGRAAEPTDLAWNVCRDVGITLKAFVRKVFLVWTDCPACDAEYEPVDWDAVNPSRPAEQQKPSHVQEPETHKKVSIMSEKMKGEAKALLLGKLRGLI
ncbi:hypothetical protein LXA43DRAFT_1102489 [Ganoderma leucocontextum]|nr:hypothetical protein LXA43DRAFT_1102489 [Ganoderma leucocontextum]